MKHKSLMLILISALMISTLAVESCKKDDGGVSGGGIYTGPTGTVTGKVVAANGVTPIQGASVTVRANYSNMPVAASDTGGNYTLAGVPTGTQTIVATKGLFVATTNANVLQNQTVMAPPAQLQSVGRLGYVVGSYDRIQDIIRDTLGYPMEEIVADSLRFSSVLARYVAIFLNCGMDLSFLDSASAATLRTYVSGGGRLYVSDWAQEVVRGVFPTDVMGFRRIGDVQTIYGRVVNASLRAFIEKDSVEIRYDLGAWEILDSLSNRPIVLLRGDYSSTSGFQTNKALAIMIDEGSGRVVYTTFHNEANITTDAVKVLTYFVFTL